MAAFKVLFLEGLGFLMSILVRLVSTLVLIEACVRLFALWIDHKNVTEVFIKVFAKNTLLL